MWRAPLQLSAGVADSDLRVISGRSRERARHRLVAKLRSVSRRAGTPPRARRFDVLLCDRALAVRAELLEIAAALERAPDPNGRTLEALHRLLRDGCASPLYNPAVPQERLRMALDRIRTELQSSEPSEPGEASPWGHRGAEGAVGRA